MSALAFAGLWGCSEESSRESASNAPEPAPLELVVPEPVVQERRVYAPARPGCDSVAVLVEGEERGSVCAEDASREGLTVLDLSDSWTPRVFQPGASGGAPEYRAKYLELAASPNADLGLHGIAPTLSRATSRLADDPRQRCDAAVDLAPLREVVRAMEAASDDKARARALKAAESGPAMSAIQSQLVCAGWLKPAQVTGRIGPSTHAALEAFRRRHMIVGAGLDADTVDALALGGEELAFRGVLRVLRERVADATGLIEDGSALEHHELVLGRELDLTRFAPSPQAALANGAADLVDLATDRAARQLGWRDAALARAFVARRQGDLKALRVAVTLPPPPSYHSAHMELRVEIDRGDVAIGAGASKSSRRPTFVMFAKDGEREVALMRWSTTIGGWKKERLEDGEVALKYKESDVGDRVWRQVIAAPAWLPPESTPETDLVHEDKEGNLSLKRDLIQPGYRNAFGLVMMIHHEAVTRGDKTTWLDHGIRSHGSVDYRSIGRGTSHGCHRLHNQLVLRMSGFVLQHRTHERRGKMNVDFRRTLELSDKSVELEVPSRGYLYELNPPLPVRVLEGRVSGNRETARSVIPVKTEETTRT